MLRSPGEYLQCLQYKAVEITVTAVEQDTVVYRISIPKCLTFIIYFNSRLGTWLGFNISHHIGFLGEPRGQLLK